MIRKIGEYKYSLHGCTLRVLKIDDIITSGCFVRYLCMDDLESPWLTIRCSLYWYPVEELMPAWIGKSYSDMLRFRYKDIMPTNDDFNHEIVEVISG
jgi:hypothetical protein